MLLTILSQAPAAQRPNPLAMWLPIILIILIMYFLIFRPQAKRQKEHQKMLASIQKGDRIVTVGGIYGTVVGIKEKENILIVKIAENVKIELARGSVARKLSE
ncbi:MAG: preprotein translocase subunit YajC [candidate division KSB1 bacterium]|nr:preprotein translocase subunit YajC [candidate division KSB1 bacterium]